MSELLKAFLYADGILAIGVMIFLIICFSFSFYKKTARVITETVEVEDHKEETVKELVIGGVEEVMEIKRNSEPKKAKTKQEK